jgi:EamA domain-containing membrane protein RarD
MTQHHHQDAAVETAVAGVAVRTILITRLAALAKAVGEDFDLHAAIENQIDIDEACAGIAARSGLPVHQLRASCRAAFH